LSAYRRALAAMIASHERLAAHKLLWQILTQLAATAGVKDVERRKAGPRQPTRP
jgi:hypothetical protein